MGLATWPSSRRNRIVTRCVGGGLPGRKAAEVGVPLNSWFPTILFYLFYFFPPKILEDWSQPGSQAQIVGFLFCFYVLGGRSPVLLVSSPFEWGKQIKSLKYTLCRRLQHDATPICYQQEDKKKSWSAQPMLRELCGIGSRSVECVKATTIPRQWAQPACD